MSEPPKEGWNWMYNARKWHYFRERRSLCCKWWLPLGELDCLQQGKDESPDNCVTCKNILRKEKKINDARDTRAV